MLAARPYGLVHVGLHERAPRGAPLALGAPFGVVARAAAPGALHHRKTMLPAQFVGRFAHRAVAGGVSVEAPAVGEGHRVDHEVVVEVGLVQMGGHHNLEAAAPQLLGEGDAHLVGRGGVGLAGANAWYPWKATMPPSCRIGAWSRSSLPAPWRAGS